MLINKIINNNEGQEREVSYNGKKVIVKVSIFGVGVNDVKTDEYVYGWNLSDFFSEGGEWL